METRLAPMELLFWDFFGPRASPTALHFEVHLKEFLRAQELDCETFLSSEGEGHQAVGCRAPAEVAAAIARALRPQRRGSSATSLDGTSDGTSGTTSEQQG